MVSRPKGAPQDCYELPKSTDPNIQIRDIERARTILSLLASGYENNKWSPIINEHKDWEPDLVTVAWALAKTRGEGYEQGQKEMDTHHG